MNPNDTNALLACTDDADFRKKYAIAVACALGGVVIAPGLLLLGYLTQTMKRATMGRKGLPEWTGIMDLALLGGAALLAMVYLLPSALLIALSVLPVLSGKAGFFSVSALISRFISFGAVLAYIVGLAFTVSGLHLYLQTNKISDIFQVAALAQKIRSKKSELLTLIGLAAVAVVAISALNWMLGALGSFISLLGFTFISLVVAYNSGRIFGPLGDKAEALTASSEETPALTAAPDAAVAPTAAAVAAPVVAVAPTVDEDDPFADDGEDAWIPS